MVSPLCFFYVDEERLELRRLGVGVADVGRQGVGQVAVLRHALEAQWIGMPTMCTFLPLTSHGRMRLVTTAAHFTSPRLERTLTIWPFLMPFSFASSSLISTNGAGCTIALERACLVQKCWCSVRR